MESRADNAQQSSSSEPKPPQDPVDYTYPCFIMQVVTELLFSYDACKVAFLSYSPKKRGTPPYRSQTRRDVIRPLLFTCRAEGDPGACRARGEAPWVRGCVGGPLATALR